MPSLSVILAVGTAVYFYSILLMLTIIAAGAVFRNRENRNQALSARYRLEIESRLASSEGSEPAPRPLIVFLAVWMDLYETAAEHRRELLRQLAHRLGLGDAALGLLQASSRKKRYGILFLGLFKEGRAVRRLADLAVSRDHVTSLLALQALLRIEPAATIPLAAGQLLERRDWAADRTARMLSSLPKDVVTAVLLEARRRAGPSDLARIVPYFFLAERRSANTVIREVLTSSSDPEILALALRIVDGPELLDCVAPLLAHPTWFVRLQAAKAAGRVGHGDSKAGLMGLLGDPQPLVAYRAAEALTQLNLPIGATDAILKDLGEGQASEILRSVLQERSLL